MDEPVIDPTTLNDDQSNVDTVPRFDKAWLLHAMSENKNRSPITKERITDPLIPDYRLMEAIECYMDGLPKSFFKV